MPEDSATGSERDLVYVDDAPKRVFGNVLLDGPDGQCVYMYAGIEERCPKDPVAWTHLNGDPIEMCAEHCPADVSKPLTTEQQELVTDGGVDQPEMDQSVEARPRVEDGALVVEFGDGTELHLEVNATEWTHESPKQGSSVDLKAEVEHFDEQVYWHLYPSRSEMPITGPADFPVVEIAPSVVPPYKKSDHEQHYAVEFTVAGERCTTDSFTFEEDAERMRETLEERDALDDVSVIEIGGDRRV